MKKTTSFVFSVSSVFFVVPSYKAFNPAVGIDLFHDYPCNCYSSTHNFVGTHGEHDVYFTLDKRLSKICLPHLAYFLSRGCRIVLLMSAEYLFSYHL